MLTRYLKLTAEETQALEEDNLCYALRDHTTYLVQKMEDKYLVTVFSAEIKIEKNYQYELT